MFRFNVTDPNTGRSHWVQAATPGAAARSYTRLRYGALATARRTHGGWAVHPGRGLPPLTLALTVKVADAGGGHGADGDGGELAPLWGRWLNHPTLASHPKLPPPLTPAR